MLIYVTPEFLAALPKVITAVASAGVSAAYVVLRVAGWL